MERTLIDEARNEYRFALTNAEVCRRVYECLSKTNPELSQDDIYRIPYSREFGVRFVRSDGQEVCARVGVSNLKRYFGAFVLAVTDDGVWFNRQVKVTKGKKSAKDEFSC